MTGTPVLLTTTQRTSTTALLTGAAVRRGYRTAELTGPGSVTRLAGQPVHWYGGPIAGRRVAAGLGLALLEPHDDWLTRLPEEFTGRRIELTTLSEARAARRPQFVKPPSDKSFPPAVFSDGSRLPRAAGPLGPDTPVLVCEPVTFAVEYRLFVLDGEPVTGSRYARYGRLDTAPLPGDPHEAQVRDFAARLLAAVAATLPSAVVVDVGLLQDPDTGREQWAVVEANMPWFAHAYAADPEAVLDVVLRSAGPRARLAPADRRFTGCGAPAAPG
ncbi:ATP-grasp domain-containing protein [Kitasatospora sp. NPDC057223]|uniref:ATP-grasp domain-containing protein n=1 Tax=Kitasatospora sp. NPDC057223 TaxID=3346055 RepID=UPI003633FD14